MLRGIAGSIALAAACAATLPACSKKEDAPKPDEGQQVQATLARFAAASAKRDYTAVCRDLLADALTTKIRSVGVPCESVIRTGLSEVEQPTLTVTSVQVQGSTATATVRSTAKGQKPSTDLVRLVKERGGWRLSSLAEPRRAPARPRKRATAKQPTVKRPGAKRPAAKRPSSKRPAAKRPAAKRPSAKRPAAKRPTVKRPNGQAPERR